MLKLSVCIPYTHDRQEMFDRLVKHIENIANGEVEIVTMVDNYELSIGSKRQQLLENCKGEYFTMIDSDDWMADDYFNLVLTLLDGVDCVTYQEKVLINNKKYTCDHGLNYQGWLSNINGFDFVRTPFYKDIIKTSIGLQVGFKDMRYGEDADFSQRVKPHLKTEHHIDKELYIYYGKHLTPQEHRIRYGIK